MHVRLVMITFKKSDSLESMTKSDGPILKRILLRIPTLFCFKASAVGQSAHQTIVSQFLGYQL